jgi:hypothetical protein
MKEVSKVVGIAVSRVSQIHAAAMVKLRASLKHLRSADADQPQRRQAVNQNADAQHFRREA